MVPLTLVLILLLLYLNVHSIPRCLFVLLSVPFSLVGAIWYVDFLNYNLSIAVWVGMIALAGVAAETGVIMMMFLDDACARRQGENRLQSIHDPREAIMKDAVLRVRPKIMTASAIILGLLPIMWSHGTGADVMQRIAAPMIGGMDTATILTLLVIPSVYFIWQSRSLNSKRRLEVLDRIE